MKSTSFHAALAHYDPRICRFVRGGTARKLRECRKRIAEADLAIEETEGKAEGRKSQVDRLQKETSDSDSAASRIRDNLRVRAMRKELQQTMAEKSEIDLEDLGRKKQEYTETFDRAKVDESDAQIAVGY